MQRAAQALLGAGAREVQAFAAHGLFVGRAAQALDDPAIARVVVTDSVPAFRLATDAPVRRKLIVVSSVTLLADAIRESHLAWRR
jgi:ribose-phosphate pyrophosphokinase